jgi:uncharacterized protein YkwD
MGRWHRVVTVAALVTLLAPAAWGQSAQHDEVEVIKAPERVPEPKADPAEAVKRILDGTNVFRKEQGRPGVTVSKELTETAAAFARYMAENDRFGHTADGRRPADRASKHGYEYCIVLENIAYEYSSRDFETADLAKGFVQGWIDSPGHRKNMLDPDVTQTGVAVARSAKTGYYYAVQLFGRPHSEAIEFSIANRAAEEVEYTIAGRKYRLGPQYTRTHTRCRPEEVKFTPVEGKELKAIKPGKGDHFVIRRDGDGVSVTKE